MAKQGLCTDIVHRVISAVHLKKILLISDSYLLSYYRCKKVSAHISCVNSEFQFEFQKIKYQFYKNNKPPLSLI